MFVTDGGSILQDRLRRIVGVLENRAGAHGQEATPVLSARHVEQVRGPADIRIDRDERLRPGVFLVGNGGRVDARIDRMRVAQLFDGGVIGKVARYPMHIAAERAHIAIAIRRPVLGNDGCARGGRLPHDLAAHMAHCACHEQCHARSPPSLRCRVLALVFGASDRSATARRPQLNVQCRKRFYIMAKLGVSRNDCQLLALARLRSAARQARQSRTPPRVGSRVAARCAHAIATSGSTCARPDPRCQWRREPDR